MTEKQIEKIRLSIKKNRAVLAAEKRKFGGFDDSAGRRYYVPELYMRISDYKGVLTYKRWFDKNFPNDVGSSFLSLSWSIAYFETGKMTEAKIYTIDTAFHNIYLHGLLLDKEVHLIDMYEPVYDMLKLAKLMLKDSKKISSQNYIDWLATFVDTDEYKKPVNRFIALNKLLIDETNRDNRSELIDHIRNLEDLNKSRGK